MEIIYAFFGVLALILVYFMVSILYKELTLQQPTMEKDGYTGPKGWPFLGQLPGVWQNIHRLHDYRLERTLKHVRNGSWGTTSIMTDVVHLCDAKLVEHVLKTNFDNYVKSDDLYDVLEEFLGDGIFNSNGDMWKKQRKSASHMFSLKMVRETMFPEMKKCGETLIERIQEYADSGEVFDLQELFFRATMDAICLIAFGNDLGSLHKKEKPEFLRAFDACNSHILTRSANPFWRQWRRFGLGKEPEFRRNIEIINTFADGVIENRRRMLEENTDVQKFDILSLFIKHAQKRGEELSNKYLRDIVMSMVIAGRDTTACVLSWMFYELMQNPDIEEKTFEECKKFMKDPSDPEELRYEATMDMSYLEAVFYETLRLHPSVPTDTKRAVKKDTLPNGAKIRAGSIVIYSPYNFGRLETMWENPLQYNPERWIGPAAEESTSSVSQYKFIHFNAGPRLCLGKHVAILEGKVLASMILHRFKFELEAPDKKINYQLGIVMSIKGGLKVRVKNRADRML